MGTEGWPRNQVVVLGEHATMAPDWLDRDALAEHVQRMVTELLQQVPPGYRLVSTDLRIEDEHYVVGADWEPE